METLYRKVKCNDRLPKTEGWYFVAVACNDFDNLDIYHWDKGSSESWINTFEWWLEELQPQEQEWISVDDRLPQRAKKVLCVCEHYGVFNGVYIDSGECYEWFNNEEGVYIRLVPITHWMPLPQPPKAKK